MIKYFLLASLLFCVSSFQKELPNSLASERAISGEAETNNVNPSNLNKEYYYLTKPENGQKQNLESFSSCENYDLRPFSQANGFDGDSFVANKNYLTTYYLHLRDNMPRNVIGICGYTGIAMWLSFYDSFWNDYFINEQYDSPVTRICSDELYSPNSSDYQSPGVYNNITSSSPSIESIKRTIRMSGLTDENSTAFKEELDRNIANFVLEQIGTNTFLGNLFQIAINKGIIKSRFIPNCTVNDDEFLDGIGVNNYIMNTIITGYINSTFRLRDRVSVVTSKMEDESDGEKRRIRSEIVELVKSGRPVLMGGNGYDDSNHNGFQDIGESSYGHVVVAYDYDETRDILYGNFGWSGSYAHGNLDEYFNIQMHDYWALNLNNMIKNRSDNYIFTDKTAYYSPSIDGTYNIISPVDYGFPASYGSQNVPTEHSFVLPETNELVNTERLRCGFIEGECINLSPKRFETGLAYLQIAFSKKIKRIEVLISWWSQDERVSPEDSYYTIDYLSSHDGYSTIVNLWRDINLSQDRYHPTRLVIDFPENVDDIVFFAQCRNPLNDRNKGRLSINKMLIEYR